MNERAWWILGGLGAAVGLWIYSRTQTGQSALPNVVGDIVSTIRGIRNNNPTNMVDSGIAWQGKTGVDADGFLQFDSMADGIRAAAVNLRNYWRLHGLNTVDGVIRRWSATDQDAYVANVAAYLGVDPQDTIDMEDDGVLTDLVRAIVRQEDSGAAELLVDNQISSAVANV